MVMKKAMNSEGMYVVGKDDNKGKFPIGFSYVLGSTIYTVKDIITKEQHADMRRLTASDGSIEDVEVSTLLKDLKDPSCKILSTGESVDTTKSKEDPQAEDSGDLSE